MNNYIWCFLAGMVSGWLVLVLGLFLFKLAIDFFGGNLAEHEQGGFEIPTNMLEDDK